MVRPVSTEKDLTRTFDAKITKALSRKKMSLLTKFTKLKNIKLFVRKDCFIQ